MIPITPTNAVSAAAVTGTTAAALPTAVDADRNPSLLGNPRISREDFTRIRPGAANDPTGMWRRFPGAATPEEWEELRTRPDDAWEPDPASDHPALRSVPRRSIGARGHDHRVA